MSKTELPPPLEAYDWKPLAAHRVTGTVLKPGQLITGIAGQRQFDFIENQVCAQINEAYPQGTMRRTDDAQLAIRIMGRLSQQLLPRVYAVRNAMAWVLPFDSKRVAQYPRTQFPEEVPWHSVGTHREGLICLFMGDAVVGGQKLSFAREAAYYYVRNSRQPALVVRRLSAGRYNDQTGDVVAHLQAVSARRGRDMARYALTHLYQAGLPGLGKKN